MTRRRSRSRWLLIGAAVLLIGAAVLLIAAAVAAAFWPRPVLVDLGTVTQGPMMLTIDEEGRTRVSEPERERAAAGATRLAAGACVVARAGVRGGRLRVRECADTRACGRAHGVANLPPGALVWPLHACAAASTPSPRRRRSPRRWQACSCPGPALSPSRLARPWILGSLSLQLPSS